MIHTGDMWATGFHATDTYGRVGYLGKKRDEIVTALDEKYGEGQWRFSWIWGENNQLEFGETCMIYEDAYYLHLLNNPELLDMLVTTTREVYDDSLSNIASGFDYLRQETDRTHIQDIAIRRAVLRLGRQFEGDETIQIRHDQGDQPLSMKLSPGKVPFHLPHLIQEPWLKGWWDPGSVECFYQSNRIVECLLFRIPSLENVE